MTIPQIKKMQEEALNHYRQYEKILNQISKIDEIEAERLMDMVNEG